jgi:ACR3 family arsenite efflux pump ArsB
MCRRGARGGAQGGECWDSVTAPCLQVVWLMVFKLVIAPLIMVGLAKLVDLDDPEARAAVIIASIPISLASFTLAEEYGVGAALLTKCVVLGTALLLPTAILVLKALDSSETFEFTKLSAGAGAGLSVSGGA